MHLKNIIGEGRLSCCVMFNRKTPDSGEGGTDVRTQDAHSHWPPHQHCKPAWGMHRVRYVGHW